MIIKTCVACGHTVDVDPTDGSCPNCALCPDHGVYPDLDGECHACTTDEDIKAAHP